MSKIKQKLAEIVGEDGFDATDSVQVEEVKRRLHDQ